MIDTIEHRVGINTMWVKLVNRCRVVCIVMYVRIEKVVVAGERGERMMMIEDTVVRLRTHTLHVEREREKEKEREM